MKKVSQPKAHLLFFVAFGEAEILAIGFCRRSGVHEILAAGRAPSGMKSGNFEKSQKYLYYLVVIRNKMFTFAA